MLIEKKMHSIRELLRADWRLQVVVHQVAGELARLGYDFALTSVERDPVETRRIYLAAGRTPPAASVHDVRPCRGADGVAIITPRDDGKMPELSSSAASIEAANRVNARCIYPRGKLAVLWHSLGGVAGYHLHCQVPQDGLEIRSA